MKRFLEALLVLVMVLTAAPYSVQARVNETPDRLVNADVNSIIKTAMSMRGVPYLYGGNSPRGFDCSGFVEYVFLKNAVKLPRSADNQYQEGKLIREGKPNYSLMKPGDLVYFDTEIEDVSNGGIKKPDKSDTKAAAKPDAAQHVKPSAANPAGSNVGKPHSKPQNITHVGIYLGDKKFINAQTHGGVSVADMTDSYWRERYLATKRVVNDSERKKSLLEYLLALFE